jgi:beta-N-acetylhexosaminidase
LKKNLLITAFFFFSAIVGWAQQANNDAELKRRIAQMLMVGFRGTELKSAMPIYRDIKTLGIGGIILFDYDAPSKTYKRNIASPKQLKKLIAGMQAIAPAKLLIAIDQEGGKVNRLKTKYGFPPTVSAQYLGKINNADTTAKYISVMAKTLSELGFNLNFAPAVDLNVNPDCPVIGKVERSFSADAEVVAQHAAICLYELQKQGVLGCIKHFPGHGSSADDTHLGIADVTNTWTAQELEPFRLLIADGKAALVMTSHVYNAHLDEDYPATMSEKIITGILRGQLGFSGVVVTDDLAMGAMVDNYSFDEILIKAITAGADILCLSNNGKTYDGHIAQKAVNIIYKAVKQGKINPQRINESYNRIMALKNKLNGRTKI